MERRPNQPPQDNREAERKLLAETVSQAYWAAVAFGVGGAGVALTGIVPEPRYNPELAVYMAVKLGSYLSMVGGGYLAFSTLADMTEFARTHIHRRGEVSPHRHEVVPPHQHNQEDIIFLEPPTPEELRGAEMLKFTEENDIRGKYREGLTELGLSTSTINALLRNASPYSKIPLSLAGLRVFLKLGVPIEARGIGSGTRAEIAKKIAPITYSGTIEDYQQLTQIEKDQMIENGFVQII